MEVYSLILFTNVTSEPIYLLPDNPPAWTTVADHCQRRRTLTQIVSITKYPSQIQDTQHSYATFLRSIPLLVVLASPIPNGLSSLRTHLWPPDLHSLSEDDSSLSLKRTYNPSERTTSCVFFISICLLSDCKRGVSSSSKMKLSPMLWSLSTLIWSGIIWYSLHLFTGIFNLWLAPGNFPLYYSPFKILPFKQSNPYSALCLPLVICPSVFFLPWGERPKQQYSLTVFFFMPYLHSWAHCHLPEGAIHGPQTQFVLESPRISKKWDPAATSF